MFAVVKCDREQVTPTQVVVRPLEKGLNQLTPAGVPVNLEITSVYQNELRPFPLDKGIQL
jgi:hypothetical protein